MPILKEGELDIISHSAEQTQRLGARLGSLLQPGMSSAFPEIWVLENRLRSGYWDRLGAVTTVTSPTFNVVHEHKREKDKQRLFHMDCYRLNNASDSESIGLDDILDGFGPLVLEWPERIESILPKERLWIELRVLEPTRRNFTFIGSGKRYSELVDKFRELAFGL